MTKVMITGSSGFIGSTLIRHLRREGMGTVGCDILEPRFSDCRPDEFVQANVLEEEALYSMLTHFKPDVIFHLAARATIQDGISDPFLTYFVNVNGTATLLRAVDRVPKAPTVILASTDKVYGSLDSCQRYTEEMPLSPNPYSTYDVSKAMADHLVQNWIAGGGSGFIVRFCNIFGPYDLHTSRIVPASIDAVLENRKPLLRRYRSSDDQSLHDFARDMLYSDDLCEALVRLVNRREALEKHIFNFGAAECVSMSEVIREVCAAASVPFDPTVCITDTSRELTFQSMDHLLAGRFLDFEPHTQLDEGVRRTYEWWKQFKANAEKRDIQYEENK